MYKKDGAKFLGLCPDRMKFWIGKIFAKDAAADRSTAQPQFFTTDLKLWHCEFGKLHGQRSEGSKAIWPQRTKFCEFFVLHADNLGCGITIFAIPERIDRQHLHVDCLSVHPLEALFNDNEMFLRPLGGR